MFFLNSTQYAFVEMNFSGISNATENAATDFHGAIKKRMRLKTSNARFGSNIAIYLFFTGLWLCEMMCFSQITAQPPIALFNPETRSEESEATRLKAHAVAMAKSIAAEYPENALIHILLGSAYFNTGQTDMAATHLRKCLALNNNILEAHEILTRIAYEKGNPEEAVRLCVEARNRGLSSPKLLNRLARAQMDLGQAEKSIQTLLEAIKVSHPLAESFYLLGQARMQARDYLEAKESFIQTTELIPDHTQAYFGLFTACQRLGQMEEAMEFRNTFVRLESIDRKDLNDRSSQTESLSGIAAVRETTARTLFGAGQIHQSQGAYTAAADLFYQSAALAKEDLKSRAALEAIHVQNKKLAEGAAAFERLASNQPENALNHFFLGRLKTRLGNSIEAESSYQKTLSLAPTWAAGHHALAELYMLTNQHLDQAEKLARRAVELEPNHARYYLLSAACIKNRHLQEALKAINQALTITPDDAKYRKLRNQLEKAMAQKRNP